MSSWLRRVSGGLGVGSGAVTVTLFWLAATWLVLVTVLVSVDAVRRALDLAPVGGVPTIASLSVVGISFLSFPYALRRGMQVSTNVVFDRFPPRLQTAIQIAVGVLGVVLFGLLAQGAGEAAQQAISRREYIAEGSLHIPVYPVRIVIVMGAIAMVLESLRSISSVLAHGLPGPVSDEGERAV